MGSGNFQDRHVVIVEANMVNIQGMRELVKAGFRVSFVGCRQYEVVYGGMPEDLRESLTHYVMIHDTCDGDELAEALMRIDREDKISGVVPGMDFIVTSTGLAVEKLGFLGTSSRTALISEKKHLTRECLEKAGVPSARYKVLQPGEDFATAARAFGFPFVVKPIDGSGSMLVSIIRDEAQLQLYLKTIAEREDRIPAVERPKGGLYVLEEYLDGLIISVEIGVCADGSIVRFMLSEGRRSAIDPTQPIGTQMPARTTPEEAEAAWFYSEQVIRALGFNVGMAHIEMALTKAGWRLIEFNPRLMGGSTPLLYGLATGVPIWNEWVLLYCGDIIDRPQLPIKQHSASRTIATFKGGVVNPDLGPEWMAPIKQDIVAHRLFVGPGERAYPLQSHLDSMGYVQLVAPSSDELRAKGDKVVRWIESQMGVPLAF